MGGCSSVDSLLFPPSNSSIHQRKQDTSMYVDANFKTIKKPLLVEHQLDRIGEMGKKETKYNDKNNNNEEQYSKKNKKRDSSSIEGIGAQEKRAILEKQFDLQSIQIDFNAQQKDQQINVSESKSLSQQQQKDSVKNLPQSSGQNISDQKFITSNKQNNQLKPTNLRQEQINEQFNSGKTTFLQSPQKSSVGAAFSSLSTQEMVDTRLEEEDVDDKTKSEVKQIEFSQDLMNQVNKDNQQNKSKENIQNSGLQDKEKQRKEKNQYFGDQGCNSDNQMEQDQLSHEKQIDLSNQTYLQNRKQSNLCRNMSDNQISKNRLSNNIYYEATSKEQLEDEENQKQIELKLNEIRKSLQSLNRNSAAHNKNGKQNQTFQNSLKNSQVQNSHVYPESVPSLILEGFQKNCNPSAHNQLVNQNLNQYSGEDPDLSLILSDSQKNSIFNSNFPSKDSKFFLDESIIHPIKANLNGGSNSNKEGQDSDSSSKREEDQQEYMRTHQSTHDLINLLQQDGQINQSHGRSRNQSYDQLRKDNKLDKNDFKINKQQEDLGIIKKENEQIKNSQQSIQNEKNNNNSPSKEEGSQSIGKQLLISPKTKGEQNDFSFCAEQSNKFKQEQENPYSTILNSKEEVEQKKQNSIKDQQEVDKNTQEPHKLLKQQSYKDELQHLNELRKNTNSFTSRYSLRQPVIKHNNSQGDNISIVIQDPRNVMTEQLVFTIQPINSKNQQSKNSSSQRVSLVSHSGGFNQEKRESVLNRTMPYRSMLENTNRVIMQKPNPKKLISLPSNRSLPSFQSNVDNLKSKNSLENQTEKSQLNYSNDNSQGIFEQTEDFEYSPQYQNSKFHSQLMRNKISEIPHSEEENFEEDPNKTKNEDKNSTSRKKISVQNNSTSNLRSQSPLEQTSLQFEEELKKMKQDYIQENQFNNEQNNNWQQISEFNNSSSPPSQMSQSNNINDFNTIGNGFQHYGSYKSFPSSNQQQSENGNEVYTISPQLKHSLSINSQKSINNYYSIQSIPQNQLSSQKQISNNSNSSTPFYSCFNTPLTSKRESQINESRVISQQQIQQRTSEINENQRVSYYKKNSAIQYYDCDSYQLQVINGNQLQNKDLLEQPELYMEWVQTLNQIEPVTLSSEAIYQFQIIKQETYQDFLSKFEQEYHFNIDLFDQIYKQNNIDIYFRSELGLDQERIFVVTGEYYVNTSSYAAFYNFKNSFNIQQILNNFDYIYSLNDDLQNTVIYANCSSKQLQKPCEFAFLKHFSFLQQNTEFYDENQNVYIQPVEQMCEIDVSLNSEEIEQYLKKNSKHNSRGEVFSGNITTYIPELNKLKVEILIEHNFNNLLNIQQAKSMYTEMFKVYLQKLNAAFP